MPPLLFAAVAAAHVDKIAAAAAVAAENVAVVGETAVSVATFVYQSVPFVFVESVFVVHMFAAAPAVKSVADSQPVFQ